ncbi:MAG: PfkB family carbohydrate kinase [Lapillicoccus sp.]
MIVTLTLNPGLDLTYSLTESFVGAVDVHRAATATLEASGKGVNVSRALHSNGIDTIAVLPLGGSTGHHLAELLDTEGVTHRSVAQQAATRVNTTMAVRGGSTAKVNGPGGRLTSDDVEALKVEVAGALGEATDDDEVWLAVCGSLPPGLDPAVVGEFVALAHAHEALCALDSSGEALAAAISAGADLLAPNRLELAEVDPRAAAAHTLEDLAAIAAEIARDRGTSLLVSLGEDGALYTEGDVVVHGHGPELTPVNTAGAGDALLSGWLAQAAAPADRMARAIRWSRAACLSATTVAPALTDPPDTPDGVTVHTLPIRRPERSTS